MEKKKSYTEQDDDRKDILLHFAYSPSNVLGLVQMSGEYHITHLRVFKFETMYFLQLSS